MNSRHSCRVQFAPCELPWLLLLAVLTLPSCGSTRSSNSAGALPRNITIDPIHCPVERESGASKVQPDGYLRDHLDEVQNAALKLRPMAWTSPACAMPDTGGCSDRDAALRERQALNQKQVDCVRATFEFGSIEGPSVPVWYEPLQALSSGMPVPIGTEFSLRALGSTLVTLAEHPYVESIVPAFGEAARLSLTAPSVPEECPAASEEPDAKLVELVSIQDKGRVPLAVDFATSVLPPLRACPESTACDDGVASGWERSVASTNEVTCVRRFIDSQLQGPAPAVPYARGDGSPLPPYVPPFRAAVSAKLSLGLGLTRAEAYQIARHPYVQRIWTSAALSFETQAACFGGDQPLIVECTEARESTVGKYDAAAEAHWRAATMPNFVLISLRRSLPLCAAPACNSCPERDAFNERLIERFGEAQACVRNLIAAVGGSAAEEPSLAGDAFTALLTWDQIQVVAAHPDVGSIQAESVSPLP